MKLSEKLLVLANWLESDNELLDDADVNEERLNIVANALVASASMLKTAADDVAKSEEDEVVFTPERLDEMAAIAKAFDESGDEELIKEASVIDDLLVGIAAPKGLKVKFSQMEDDRIADLKKRYSEVKKTIDSLNKISDAISDIEHSKVYQAAPIRGGELSTRWCVDHPGVSLRRIGENEWQCMMDKKIYNYASGFVDLSGRQHPAQGVEYQTRTMVDTQNTQGQFSTRNQQLGLEQ